MSPARRIYPSPSHSYFVVMIDHGRRGCEAVVDPEITQAGVIGRIQSGEYADILFIHQVGADGVADVTGEMFALADSDTRQAA